MIRLQNADCFDVFPQIASGTVDLLCADIPYGTTQCRWDSVLDLALMWEQLYRIVKPSAAIVLFSAQPFTSVLINSNLRDWWSEWIWEKGNATGFLNAKSSRCGHTKTSRCFIAVSRPITRNSPTGTNGAHRSVKPSIQSATARH